MFNKSGIWGEDLAPVKSINPPPPTHTHTIPCSFSCCQLKGCSSAFADSSFVAAVNVCISFVFGPWFVMQYLVSFLILQSSR